MIKLNLARGLLGLVAAAALAVGCMSTGSAVAAPAGAAPNAGGDDDRRQHVGGHRKQRA